MKRAPLILFLLALATMAMVQVPWQQAAGSPQSGVHSPQSWQILTLRANDVVVAPGRSVPIRYDVPLQNCTVWASCDLQTWRDVTADSTEIVWVLNTDGETWDIRTAAQHTQMFFRVSGEPVTTNN